MRCWAASLALAVALGWAGPSLAGTRCASIAGGDAGLEQVDAEVRLRFIQDRLQHAAWRTRIWHWSWISAYSAATAVNLGLAIGVGGEHANDRYVGAGFSAIGVLSLVALPQKVMRDSRWLDRRIALAGVETDPCAVLADAERLLIRDAKNQAFGRSPLIHAGTFLFNVGLTLIFSLGFQHVEAGMVAGFVGLGVGELQIATQPTDAIQALGRYRAGDLGPPPRRTIQNWTVMPTFSREQQGLRFALSF